ncbi:hypothetical protein ASPWEDRAFT_37683 [Aspergillus wentii DTO 134E9]|uniref:Uncharacterized protein n=1 Tax=Aspergillus wentii DTO 134E9 TaxID=1073089 RepID=A0A1L9RXY4_ASPWE|nr:uncharacterized protein ASPWEDRAFT_37683 [Aspergillus wentii DTO 134E9]OJJ39826.1 hypothetical protein ASPWEDRAFT_37683 [Aspergillus wentii DTO 134E9]
MASHGDHGSTVIDHLGIPGTSQPPTTSTPKKNKEGRKTRREPYGTRVESMNIICLSSMVEVVILVAIPAILIETRLQR